MRLIITEGIREGSNIRRTDAGGGGEMDKGPTSSHMVEITQGGPGDSQEGTDRRRSDRFCEVVVGITGRETGRQAGGWWVVGGQEDLLLEYTCP